GSRTARGPRRAWKRSWTWATTSWAARSAPSATPPPSRFPRRSSTSATRSSSTARKAAAPSTRPLPRRGRCDPMTVQPAKTDTVTVTIDGYEVSVPKGTLVIRAAEQIGITIPRFCDHPLLDPIGACRQCLVDIEGQRKPLASCTTVCTDGMVVKTQFTSPVADKAQQGVMELLLINHPLDC